MPKLAKVSAIIVNWNTADLSTRVVNLLLQVAFENYPVVRVLLLPENLGFAKACNIGAKNASGDYLLFLNPDVTFKPRDIAKLISFVIKNPDIGVAGPKFLNQDGSLQLSACTRISPWSVLIGAPLLFKIARIITLKPKIIGHVYSPIMHERIIYPDWILGACLLFRREAFEKVGGFDERFFMYCEEMDLCLRVKQAGYQVIYYPACSIVHYGGKSAAQVPLKTAFRRAYSEFLFFEKHNGRLIGWAHVLINIFGNLVKAGLLLPIIFFSAGARRKFVFYLRYVLGYLFVIKKHNSLGSTSTRQTL